MVEKSFLIQLRNATEDINKGHKTLSHQAPFHGISVIEPLLQDDLSKEVDKSSDTIIIGQNNFLMNSEDASLDIELDNIKNTLKVE